jgi:hypothetical protein
VKFLTLTQFKAWLKRRDTTEIIGYTGDVCGCPLAEFINHATQRNNAMVGANVYSVDMDTGLFHLPEWAKRLRARIDECGPGQPITVSSVLCILSE